MSDITVHYKVFTIIQLSKSKNDLPNTHMESTYLIKPAVISAQF